MNSLCRYADRQMQILTMSRSRCSQESSTDQARTFFGTMNSVMPLCRPTKEGKRNSIEVHVSSNIK